MGVRSGLPPLLLSIMVSLGRVVSAAVYGTGITVGSTPALVFVSTAPTNDFVTAARLGNLTIRTAPTVADALAVAQTGDGLLLLADAMLPVNPDVPQTNTTTNVTADQWTAINNLQLRVYLEFPSQLPPSVAAAAGVHSHAVDNTLLPVAQSMWERVVVANQDGLGPALPYLALLHPHKHVDYVQMPASLVSQSDLVIARVAGYDNASFGLPTSDIYPLLVTVDNKVMVAATQLSHCRTRRFAPSDRWMAVATAVLDFASSGHWSASSSSFPDGRAAPLWTASVTASFSRDAQLPADSEMQALQRGVQFYRNARLLPDATRAVALGMMVPSLPDFDLRLRQ
jgi:hypothetical protein